MYVYTCRNIRMKSRIKSVNYRKKKYLVKRI